MQTRYPSLWKPYLLKSSIFRSLLFSFAVLLLVPVLISTVAFTHLTNQSERYVLEQWGQISDTMRVDIDNGFSALDRLPTSCQLDTSIGFYARAQSVEDITKSKDRLRRISSLNSALPFYMYGLDFALSYCIAFENSALVFQGGSFLPHSYFVASVKGEAYAPAFSALKTGATGYIVTQLDAQGLPAVIIRYDVYESPLGGSNYTVYTQLNQANIVKMLDQYAELLGGWVGIWDAQSGLLFSSRVNAPYSVHLSDSLDIGRETYRRNGMVCLTRGSGEELGFTYVGIIPQSEIAPYLSSMYSTVLLSFLFSLLVGLALVYYFSRRSYQPIRSITETITQHSNAHLSEEAIDFPFIIDEIRRAYSERKTMRGMVLRNILRRLMHQELDQLYLPEQSIEIIDALSVYQYALCLCLPATNETWAESLGSLEQPFLPDAFSQRVAQRLQALLPEGFHVYDLDIEDFFGCVITWETEQPRQQEILRQTLAALNDALQAEQTHLMFAVSRPHVDLLKLHKAYSESLSAFQQGAFEGRFKVAFATEPQAMPVSEYPFTPDMETRFMNAVRLGDTQAAMGIARKVLPEHGMDSSQVEPILWQDMLNAVVKVIVGPDSGLSAEAQQNHLAEIHRITKKLGSPAHKRLSCLEHVLEALPAGTAQGTAEKPGGKSAQIIRQIDALIDERLTDEALCVSALADLVGMNARYMSMLYKEKTGESLLDRIHRKRIALFKHTLADSTVSIQDAAAMVGYAHVNTLTRWFKKMEGITPGQYRDLL